MQEEEDASRQFQREAIVLAMKRRDTEAFAALSHAATLGDVEEVNYISPINFELFCHHKEIGTKNSF